MVFILLGRSGSGKDTIRKEIINNIGGLISFIPLHTNREIRPNEKNGEDYFFINSKEDLPQENIILSERHFYTVRGDQIYIQTIPSDYKENDYLVTSGTIDSVADFASRIEKDFIVPIIIEVNDKELLLRTISRESENPNPRYDEICRRFLSDKESFKDTEEFIHFQNEDFKICGIEVSNFILELISKKIDSISKRE